MKRSWLADAVGVVAALVAFAWFPGLDDPLTYIKMMILAVGGLALLPWGIQRWSERWSTSSPGQRWLVVPAVAALGLGAWVVVSTLGSGAPWPVSVFGWYGRGDGLLSYLGAIGLFMAASGLTSKEVPRAASWLVAGASLVALIGLLQVLGVSIPAGALTGVVTGTMGNQNFAGGYMAMMLPVALALALWRRPATWVRIAAACLVVLLVLEIFLARSLQGPVAASGALAAFYCAWALAYRGPRRLIAQGLALAVVVSGVLLLVLSAFGSGPLTRLWSETTFVNRQQYWSSAVNMMSGLPVFGTGPGSFARYVGEYRSDTYVEILGPFLNVSAAHNIALHVGATLGVPALVLWSVTFLGAAVAFIVRVPRINADVLVPTIGVFAGLTAYLIQGLVSIDMLPVLATGWVLCGLSLAGAVGSSPAPPSQRASAQARSSIPATSPAPKHRALILTASAALGLAALALTWWQTAVFASVRQITTFDQALSVIQEPLLPCSLRLGLIESVATQIPPQEALPSVSAAANLDPRCPAIKNLEAQVALSAENLQIADSATSTTIRTDPRSYLTWILRSQYFLQSGDLDAAVDAYTRAVQVRDLYANADLGAAEIAALRDRLLAAGANV